MEQGIRHLDETGARQLVLVRAIEDVDTEGKLLSDAEREQLEREALASSRQTAGGTLDAVQYLQQRARRILAAVERRNPPVAALQDREPWRAGLMLALPLAACVFGAAIDRIDNPQQVNMLSPPLLGVLAWNLLAYLLLTVSALLPQRWGRPSPLPAVQRWVSAAWANGRRTGRLRSDILARFHSHWLRAAGVQQWLWWKQLLHLCAAAWGVGVAVSVVLGGLVREYRVGWESTLLDVGQVHAFLSILFAPVVALLPFEPFTVADLQRMAFRSGADIGVGEARRWIWMYLALLGLVVVVPRMLLAGWVAWRRRQHGRAVPIDLRDPYFVQVLARVSPVRITLALVAAPGPGREEVLGMLRQVADHAPPREQGPWTLLSTAKGDVLRVFEVPPGFRAPAAAVTVPAGNSAAAAQAWLQELLGRFRAPARLQVRDPVQALLAETDLILVAPGTPSDLEDATALLHWVAQPALVLVAGEEGAYRSAVQRLALAAQVLPLSKSTAHWLADGVLLDAAVPRVASGKRAGFERLAAAWKDRGAARFAEAVRMLASEVVRAARDAEPVGSTPVGLRQLVSGVERDAAQRAREAARTALLERLRERQTGLFADLVQLYRGAHPLVPLPSSPEGSGFTEQQTVDTPQAGMAGAATGAAMGAGLDLLTGGLTLGAATALGAFIGGSAAFAAAAWRNRGTPSGQHQVQLGDDLLQALTETLLLVYLAVAHRGVRAGQEPTPATWRSEVVAAVEARRPELARLWGQARTAPDEADAVGPLAEEMEELARRLLARL